VQTNQALLRGFLVSCPPFLHTPTKPKPATVKTAAADDEGDSDEDSDDDVPARAAKRQRSNDTGSGLVHITLRKSPFYDSWDVEGLAAECGYECVRVASFRASDFPGYTPVRTHPAFRDAPGTDVFLCPMCIAKEH
jgi:hypothetical protein